MAAAATLATSTFWALQTTDTALQPTLQHVKTLCFVT